MSGSGNEGIERPVNRRAAEFETAAMNFLGAAWVGRRDDG